MNSELKAKWVAALRSGQYRQGKEALYADGAYCCLGVLCRIAGATMKPTTLLVEDEDGEQRRVNAKVFFNEYNYTEEEELNELLRYFDITGSVEIILIDMNDQEEKDFSEIADWIAKHDLTTGREIEEGEPNA